MPRGDTPRQRRPDTNQHAHETLHRRKRRHPGVCTPTPATRRPERHATPSDTPTPTDTPTDTPTPTNTPTATPLPSTYTLLPVADSYVYGPSPDTNYGSSTALRTDASPDTRSYLRFDLQGVSGTIISATLRVYAETGSSVGFDIQGVADNTWTEAGLTYNNSPAMLPIAATSGAIGAGTWMEVDITALATGGEPLSPALTSTSSTAVRYSSRQGPPARFWSSTFPPGRRRPRQRKHPPTRRRPATHRLRRLHPATRRPTSRLRP